MSAYQSKTCSLRCVCNMMVCAIYQGDLPLKLAKVVQNGQVSDKETAGTEQEQVNECRRQRQHSTAGVPFFCVTCRDLRPPRQPRRVTSGTGSTALTPASSIAPCLCSNDFLHFSVISQKGLGPRGRERGVGHPSGGWIPHDGFFIQEGQTHTHGGEVAGLIGEKSGGQPA